MRGPSGRRSLPSFVAIRHLLREIIATSGSYYGVNGGQYGPVSVPSATLSPESDGTETPYWTFGMRGPSGRRSLPRFRRYQTPTPRDNRDFRLLLWGNGANTGQLAYLRRHFHRKRWH
ncbi:hypothetical protein DPMN_056945 [Dreissena polymorpha]|uniref:Uncharacterized protein n=1 Tax=Dreissena polymorpha TaxID=45954 RepID=A0A9D4HTQ4_DREPO|nr:hypothetical protein DPMN_056945 [Dreissena polymorpha]